jgi:protein-L-isoaspartate(D-aspartate) O-methyltransferase
VKTSKDPYTMLRHQMVDELLLPNGVTSPRVLEAMRRVPRHLFVGKYLRGFAYDDYALPLGEGQWMLPPLMVGLMLQALSLRSTENVLEVGTGGGYLTALLVLLGGYVFSIERLPTFSALASDRLNRLGAQRLDLHTGDGTQGLADMAPFPAIIVSGAVPRIPKALAQQLAPDGGRMVLPVGTLKRQELRLIQRKQQRWQGRTLATVEAPPLIGRYGFPPTAINGKTAHR